ncbi:MAG: lysophospholipid acyltransferase family protein, partial [Nitrospirae bacterium]|nr:lysophospholipid acyltransferase family protein [Nitrospirota bacterium]
PFRSLIQRLPLKLVALLGGAGGIVMYKFSQKRRNIITREISLLFSKTAPLTQEEIEKIAYKGLQVFCKRQMENLYWGKLNREITGQMTSIDGIQYLENALKNGSGAILLTAHFGSHLLPPLVLGYKGYKIHQAAGPPLIDKQRPIYRRIFNQRVKESETQPINFIVIGPSTRNMLRVLQKNEILFIAFDGSEASKMIPVNFFNQKAFFSPGTFKLSFMTKAPILPTFIIRQKDDTHRIIIGPPFELVPAEDEEKTLALNTARFAKIFEEYILKYPCHYVMTLMRVEELIQEGALKTNLFQTESK